MLGTQDRFQVLDAALPEDRATWLKIWNLWPNRQVSAHPAYVQLFARPCDRPLCATMDVSEGQVLFPLILRPLSAEYWAGDDNSLWDLVTPYGYGGPFAWGNLDPACFWSNFDVWARKTSVTSLFVRLSLFPEQLIPFVGDIEVRANNIVRTLDLGPDAMWMDYEHKVRKNVKRAQRAGLEVTLDFLGERLDDFLEMYYLTMARRNALSSYYFPRKFFENVIRHLSGQFVFFHALHERKLVSTEMVLVSSEDVYSFLGGTLVEAFDLRPNDLLKHSIITWAREQGKKRFVLGGGYSDEDGIFRYKMSFAPNGVVPFKIGTLIYDPEPYERLVRMRREWEVRHNNEWKPRSGFFPVYRA